MPQLRPSARKDEERSSDAAPSAQCVGRTFTRNDLDQALAKIADREPDPRLAA